MKALGRSRLGVAERVPALPRALFAALCSVFGERSMFVSGTCGAFVVIVGAEGPAASAGGTESIASNGKGKGVDRSDTGAPSTMHRWQWQADRCLSTRKQKETLSQR